MKIVEQSSSPFLKFDLLAFDKVRLVTGIRGDVFTYDVRQYVNTTESTLNGRVTRGRPNYKANLVQIS